MTDDRILTAACYSGMTARSPLANCAGADPTEVLSLVNGKRNNRKRAEIRYPGTKEGALPAIGR